MATGTLGLLVGTWMNPCHVMAIARDESGAIEFDGSLRTITAAAVNYENKWLFGNHPADGFSQTILRLTLGGHPWDWLGFEVHGVQNLSFSTTPNTVMPGVSILSGGTGGDFAHYLALSARHNWLETNLIQGTAFLWLDRCNVKFSLPSVDVILGRQAISLGTTYFWNPLDVFSAFDPRQFDRDYKAGVDAIRVDIALGEATGINLIGALGRQVGVTYEKFGEYLDTGAFTSSWYGSALIARVFTTLDSWDLSIQGGKIYGGFHLGGGISGELGPLEVRGEFAYFNAMESETLLRFEQYDYKPLGDELELFDNFSFVIGVGHHFENTLTIEAEYFYNGLGTDSTGSVDLFASSLRVGLGDGFHLGRHLLGVVISYEFLPILNGSLAWIFSAADTSSLIQPGFVFSLSEEVDFLFGAMIGLGARPKEPTLFDLGQKSEFGTYPNMYYMEFKFYF